MNKDKRIKRNWMELVKNIFALYASYFIVTPLPDYKIWCLNLLGPCWVGLDMVSNSLRGLNLLDALGGVWIR